MIPASYYEPLASDRDVLDAIRELTAERGFPPTYGELARQLGYASKESIHRRIHRFREEGLVDFEPRLPRTLRVISPPTTEGTA